MDKTEIKNKIIDAAKERRLLYYAELLPDNAGDAERRNLYRILGDINEKSDENESGLLLSALVVSEETGMPGPGFFRVFGRNISPDNAFGYFAGAARRVFSRHAENRRENFGVLVDADQFVAKKVDDFLRDKCAHAGIVCRACKQNNDWDSSPLKRHNGGAAPLISIHQTRQKIGKANAADFYLSMAGAQMIGKTYNKYLMDSLYVMSGDRDLIHFKYFAKASDKGLGVRCFDNQFKEWG